MLVSLNVVNGPASGKTFKFDQPDCFLFGRSPDARISIPADALISGNHFSLLLTSAQCVLRDHSSNGTYVNGVRFGGRNALPPGARQAPDGAKEAVLKSGDEISVGDTRIQVLIELPVEGTAVQIAVPAAGSLPTGVQAHAPLGAEIDDLLKAAPTPVAGAHSTIVTKPGNGGAPPAAHPTVVSPAPTQNFPEFPGYRIDKIIGRGGMGVVYKGVEVATERAVAIKVMLPPKGSGAQKMIQAFEREINIHQTLKHPHIVEMYGLVRTGTLLGVVLEFIEGQDLAQYTKSRGGTVALAEAAPIMLEALSGLGHAHAQGVVHRDLKPENIFLLRKENKVTPKVADFGLAKSYEASGKSLFEVAGTPPYWPREHLSFYGYLHPSSDVFSIAAVFYQLLSGTHARAGMADLIETSKRNRRPLGFGDLSELILGQRVVPIRECIPGFPAPVAEVLDRALREVSLDRSLENDHKALRKILNDLRYPSANEFRDALAAALKSAGV